ncbi:MAG TPA: haloacid dehalogenase type II [Alphaproteobacteria bacterium]|nr:haloacid dehalogenase type II [Alphaproteobacteria bacterium]
MTGERIDGIKACVFDAYGTLFDVASPVDRLRGELGADAGRLTAVWRAKQLEYTWLRSLMGRHADFRQVTGDALDFALADTGLEPDGLRERLMDGYLTLDAYADAAPGLDRLRTAGLKTAILSNGSPEMLDAATKSAGLRGRLDAVLSVEEVGVYKPHASVYRLAVERLGVPKEGICFVSSNGWDAAGAATFGFRVAWLNRAGRPAERLPDAPDAEIAGLDRLPGILGL